jgi:hypothetical protein
VGSRVELEDDDLGPISPFDSEPETEDNGTSSAHSMKTRKRSVMIVTGPNACGKVKHFFHLCSNLLELPFSECVS